MLFYQLLIVWKLYKVNEPNSIKFQQFYWHQGFHSSFNLDNLSKCQKVVTSGWLSTGAVNRGKGVFEYYLIMLGGGRGNPNWLRLIMTGMTFVVVVLSLTIIV